MRGHAEAQQIESARLLDQDADDHRLTVKRRHCGNAEVRLLSPDARTGAPVLRQTSLGDIQAGEDLHARNDGARHPSGQHLVQAEHTIDAQADAHPIARRLDMNVGG